MEENMENRYKMIAVDIDGTLLNDEKKITPKTLQALKKAQEKGIALTICSGRNISGIEEYMELLKPEGPVICTNGAIILSPGGKETLFSCTMDKADAEKVYRLGLELGATMLIWCGNAFYTNELNERSYGYKRYSCLEPVLLEDFGRLNGKGITKILYCSEPDIVNGYLEKVDSLQHMDGILPNTTYCKSLPIFLEFFNSKVSKGNALEAAASYLGIQMKDVIAFGDGMNDCPMIKKAGLGIAMGNSHRTLKGAAAFVTLDNNNDGIAYALEFLKII